jgi:hypothetical protein
VAGCPAKAVWLLGLVAENKGTKMVARIKADMTIGVSLELRDSLVAWARHLSMPNSEYCRKILERHQRRIGYLPPAQSENVETNPPITPFQITPSN